MHHPKTQTNELITQQQMASIIPQQLHFLEMVTINHIDTQFPQKVILDHYQWKALFPFEGDMQGEALFSFRGQNIAQDPYQDEWIQDVLIESCSVILGNLLTNIFKKFKISTDFQYPLIIEHDAIMEEKNANFKLQFKSEFIIKINGENNYLDLFFWEHKRE